MVGHYQPASLKEALELRSTHTLIPYAGGTDLMVHPEKDANYLFLNKIQELQTLYIEDNMLHIGAFCTFTQLLEFDGVPSVLKDALILLAAPAIRNMGTIGGNICNGSPKADSALILVAANANLKLASSNGERLIPIRDFYKGRNTIDLHSDELLVEILMPLSGLSNYCYEKIGGRKALAISRISFCGIMDIQDGKIVNCATAFGAIEDTIVCDTEIDSLLIGKSIEEAKAVKKDYLNQYKKRIQPLQGRVSADYRKEVCRNLLQEFLNRNGI